MNQKECIIRIIQNQSTFETVENALQFNTPETLEEYVSRPEVSGAFKKFNSFSITLSAWLKTGANRESTEEEFRLFEEILGYHRGYIWLFNSLVKHFSIVGQVRTA